MKANKDFRPSSKDSVYESDDAHKRQKLAPERKPKNERLYDVDDFEEEYDLKKYKRESISDFYDDGEDQDEEYEEEEEYDEYDAEEDEYGDDEEDEDLQELDLEEDGENDDKQTKYYAKIR